MNQAMDPLELHHRRGVSTIEFVTAAALFATLGTVLVPFLGQLLQFNHNIADRELALRETMNLVARLQAGETNVQLSEHAIRELDDAELQIEQHVDDEQESLYKTTLMLRWNDNTGQPVTPVRMMYWSQLAEDQE